MYDIYDNEELFHNSLMAENWHYYKTLNRTQINNWAVIEKFI